MRRIKAYLFDNYIIGDSNRVAFETAKAAADKPGKACNPLFIYGNSGLGKTHLLNAICHQITVQLPDAVIGMYTADEMAQHMARAIKAERTELWREKVLAKDVLLIDDAHVLEGKSATQAEFASLIHSLVEREKQVVVTSSVPPEKLPVLEASFREDYDQGRLVEIQLLDAEMCRSIVLDKAVRCGLRLSEEAVDKIVSVTDGEVRRIEGILNHIHAEAETKEL